MLNAKKLLAEKLAAVALEDACRKVGEEILLEVRTKYFEEIAKSEMRRIGRMLDLLQRN